MCAGEGETTAPLDVDAIQVDPSYAGPKLRDDRVGNIDLAFINGLQITDVSVVPRVMVFCVEMIEHFKGQRQLHRKTVLQVLTAAKILLQSYKSLLRIDLTQPTTPAASSRTPAVAS